MIINLHNNYVNLQQSTKYLVGCFLFSLLSNVNAYERIISTTGNASEVIAELGLADKLIAVDTTSTLPKAVMQDKPKIGYRRHLSSEGILSLNPDLLILAPDAGPPAVVKQIQAMQLHTVTIQDNKSIDGVINDIKMLANELDAQAPAASLIARIRQDEKAIHALINDYTRSPKIVFLMDGGSGQLMALGDGTAGDALIGMVGGQNAFSGAFKSFKPVSVESMVEQDIDMIVIASHGAKAPNIDGLVTAVDDYPNLALTQAAKTQCIFRIDTVKALGFGPSVVVAAQWIATAAQSCVNQDKHD